MYPHTMLTNPPSKVLAVSVVSETGLVVNFGKLMIEANKQLFSVSGIKSYTGGAYCVPKAKRRIGTRRVHVVGRRMRSLVIVLALARAYSQPARPRRQHQMRAASSISPGSLLQSDAACHSQWACKYRHNASALPAYLPPSLRLANLQAEGNKTTLDIVKYQLKYEPFMFELIGNILARECQPRTGADGTAQRAVFVDSGANEGMWSVLAGALGCHVIAVEPQPRCRQWLHVSLALNPLAESNVHVWGHFLSTDARTTLSVSPDSCDGGERFSTAGGDGATASYHDGAKTQPATPRVRITSRRLDASEFLEENAEARVVLWHLDTEGAEVPVLRSAADLFERQQIDRVVFEMTPRVWAQYNVSVRDAYAELAQRFDGWRCVWACTGAAIADWRAEGARVEHALKGGKKGHGGLCRAPWNRQAGAVDVYCVRKGVEA